MKVKDFFCAIPQYNRSKVRVLDCKFDGTADEMEFSTVDAAKQAGLDDRDVYDYKATDEMIILYI